jgi:hypothetical protein
MNFSKAKTQRSQGAKQTKVFWVVSLCAFVWAGAFAGEPLYHNDFEKAEVGKTPDDLLVLDGQFAVKEENGNKFLELPGAPLDTFGALFGPTTNGNVVISAKIFGTAKGRRFPTFAIGVNGVGGYRMQVSPGKKMLELYRGDSVVKCVPYEWKSGEWTELRLQATRIAAEMKIEGKAWNKGASEPKEATISFDDPTPAGAGRASLWGSPYSGTSIQFDDLAVTALTNQK